jgi:peptide/nickel transport system ATP-binding protein
MGDQTSLTLPALEVRDLTIRIGDVSAVNDVNFVVPAGRTFGLVGESGAGKSITARALIGLLPARATVVRGEARLNGDDLLAMSESERRRRRGRIVALVLQNPLRALNPTMTVGAQIVEALRAHSSMSSAVARRRASELLERVQIPAASQRLDEYPHQFSGGMRQRVAIAIALACSPSVLIADEPTTALDVTTQAQILHLLRSLQAQFGMAIVLITHDLRLAAEYTDTIGVMYAGRIVEHGPTTDVVGSPRMPYTLSLLAAMPTVDALPHTELAAIPGRPPDLRQLLPGCPFVPRCVLAQDRCRAALPPLEFLAANHQAACWFPLASGADAPGQAARTSTQAPVMDQSLSSVVLDAQSISHTYRTRVGGRSALVQAVSDVSLVVREGETFGLLGGTGSGKSTLLRALVQLPPPTGGRVFYRGQDLTALKGGSLVDARRGIQMVFQDPYASLDSRWRVKDLIGEPLLARGEGTSRTRQQRVAELLELVGLEPRVYADRSPRQLSGGQCQRVAIARALALAPDLLLCDEPVSALDVSIQAQILNLFEELRRRLRLSYLFVSHDLSVIRHVSDRIGVMYLGKLVEVGKAEAVYAAPAHPYTAALMAAVPSFAHEHARPTVALAGDLPSAVDPPSGCRFRTLCPLAEARCAEETPQLLSIGQDHAVACHFPLTT